MKNINSTIDKIVPLLQNLEDKYACLAKLENPKEIENVYLYLLNETKKMEKYMEGYILGLETQQSDSTKRKVQQLKNSYTVYKAVRQRVGETLH